MIRVSGLTKQYKTTFALRGLDLHVPKGAIFGLIGPNGAGKSTTLRILAGLMPASGGSVWVNGVDALADPDLVRAMVGYMPDHFGVYEELTCREYLEFYAAANRVPRSVRARVADDLLQLVGLPHKRDEWVMGLSLGMKQRLGLARALVHDPPVLLLDEPASGLDPRARAELRELLQELSRMGKTVIISSHILPELAEMCTHAGIISGGRMVAAGPLDELGGLSQSALLEIEVMGEAEPHAPVLSAQPGVVAVEAADDRLVARFTGDRAEQAALLKALVMAGVPVLSVVRRQDSLEELFLRHTEEVGA